VGFILDLIGALVSTLRTTLGKPKLVFSFSTIEKEDQQVLICEVYNSPHRGWLMRTLQIPRPNIDTVSFMCTIKLGEERIGNSFWAKVTTIDKVEVGRQVSLPVSPIPIMFPILIHSKGQKGAQAVNTDAVNTTLSGGVFTVEVVAWIGCETVRAQQDFVVKDGQIKLGRRTKKHEKHRM